MAFGDVFADFAQAMLQKYHGRSDKQIAIAFGAPDNTIKIGTSVYWTYIYPEIRLTLRFRDESVVNVYVANNLRTQISP